MSRLKELIHQYCLNGVEYKPLWALTIWDKKFNAVEPNKQKTTYNYHYFFANDLKQLVREYGDVKILTTNTSNLFTVSDLVEAYIADREIIAIPGGGNPNVQYYNGRFVTSDNRIATALNPDELSVKYLYYFMQSKLDLIGSFYRESGIKHPDMAKVLDMLIPVPPIPVQQEIVRILDKFTELETELETELGKRQKQYEYYRDKLLSFEETT